MPQYAVAGTVRSTSVNAPDEAAAVQQSITELTAVLPPAWVLTNVVAERPVLNPGDWVVGTRPDLVAGGEREAYARVVDGPGGQENQRQLEFGDGLKRGIEAFVRFVEAYDPTHIPGEIEEGPDRPGHGGGRP